MAALTALQLRCNCAATALRLHRLRCDCAAIALLLHYDCAATAPPLPVTVKVEEEDKGMFALGLPDYLVYAGMAIAAASVLTILYLLCFPAHASPVRK
eukprot:8519173-Pyramimonas_sp.AAC.1